MDKIPFTAICVVWFQQMKNKQKTVFFFCYWNHTSISLPMLLNSWPDLTTNFFIFFTLYTVYTFLNEMWPIYFHLSVPSYPSNSEIGLLWQIVHFGAVSLVCCGRENFGGKSSPAFTSGKTQTAYRSISRIWSQHVLQVQFHYQYSQ